MTSTRVIPVLVLIAASVIALGHTLPTQSRSQNPSRQKRGFRTNSSNRVAHGFGKRQNNNDNNDNDNDSMDNDVNGWMEEVTSSGLMTVQELTQLSVLHPSLAEALIQKFIDKDGDGMVTTQELFDMSLE